VQHWKISHKWYPPCLLEADPRVLGVDDTGERGNKGNEVIEMAYPEKKGWLSPRQIYREIR
jgi:hypothetical protein